MRKILLTMGTGYAGTSTHEAYLVPDDMPDDELDEWAYWKAVEHAESYGIYPPSDDDSTNTIEGHWRLFEEKDRVKVLYGDNQEIDWNEY